MRSRRLLSTSVFVAGWSHDVSGLMLMRHHQLCAHLHRRGWSANVEPHIGIATHPALALDELHQTVTERNIGWFLAFGEWANAANLVRAPFRNTITMFCANRRIAPSREFLGGLYEHNGALAYQAGGDDRRPAVHIVTTRPLARIERLLDQ